MEQDNPWKEVVEEFLEGFLFTFFPSIYREIDFSKGYEFLEQELEQIAVESETGNRIVDKLVKVFRRDGAEKWLLIHIEIQGYAQENFPERMYVYNYRIFDKFGKDVVSLALLTDDNPNFRPREYRRALWGCNVLLEYPMVKSIDFRERWAELEASSNPFAIIVAAFLKTLETEGNVQERYSWKKKLLLSLYERGMERETILKIYRFIDWIMKLPKELNKELYDQVKTAKEIKTMPYISTAERIGMEKGLAQGLATILEIKFGKAGQQLVQRAYQVEDVETLQKLMAKVKRVKSLPRAKKLFDEIEPPVAN